MKDKVKYVTVSIPKVVSDRIDYYVDNLGFWPSRSSFVREAILEKFTEESQRSANLMTLAEFSDRSEAMRGEKDALLKVSEPS